MMLDWTQITGDGGWHKRRKHATVVYQGSIYIIGGFFSGGGLAVNFNDVWRSQDGHTWECVCKAAPWPGRDGHTAVVFHDYIYVFGGTCDAYSCFNDVWRSKDGSQWEEVTKNAPWPERWQHAAVVHDGAMYVLGGWGMVMFNDVWTSQDGISWEKVVESSPWSKRMFHVSVVFQNRIYVIGGFDGRSYLNDVWKSSDGINWTQVCENGSVEWAARRGFSAVVYEDWIYVVGGDTGAGVATDVWSSADGEIWELIWSDKPCCSRIGHSVVVHRGSVYVLGGVDGSGEYLSDVHQSIEASSAPDLLLGDDPDQDRAGSISTYDIDDLHRLVGEGQGDYTSAKSEYETTASSVFTVSDIRAQSTAYSMSSIILRASQLRQLRQRLHEAWRGHLEVVEHLEKVLGPLGRSPTFDDEGNTRTTTEGTLLPSSFPSTIDSYSPDGEIVAVSESESIEMEEKECQNGLPTIQPDCQRLEEDFAVLEQIQASIRKAAVSGNAARVQELVSQRTELAKQCYGLVDRVVRCVDELEGVQAKRIEDLDLLALSLAQRLGGGSSISIAEGHTLSSCPGLLEPIRENNEEKDRSLNSIALAIRRALQRLTNRSPNGNLLPPEKNGRGGGRGRGSSALHQNGGSSAGGAGGAGRGGGGGGGATTMSDYNPARTDHILRNLEAALQEKSCLAHELSGWLSKPPQMMMLEKDGGGGEDGSNHLVGAARGQDSAHTFSSPQKQQQTQLSAESNNAPLSAAITSCSSSSCPSLSPAPTYRSLSAAPDAASVIKPPGATSTRTTDGLPPPAPDLRRGLSSSSSTQGEGGQSNADIVSLARMWDETDLLYRLQNQAHLAINRELQHMPSELDQANMMGRLLLRQALLRTTNKVTEAQAQGMELRAFRDTVKMWKKKLQAWMAEEGIMKRCEEIKAEEKEFTEQILNLEDEQIDCRSNLDKRMKRRAPQEEVDALVASSKEAGRAVRQLRKRRRQLLSSAAEYVRQVAPELLIHLPEILNPFAASQGRDQQQKMSPSGIGIGGSLHASSQLPRRTLDDYDEVKPWDATEGSGGLGSVGRHVLLRARYDGEDVVLKGYALHNERQRADLEREVSILCSIHHDAIIQVRALVEDSIQAHSHAVPMLYLEFPYCSGGSLIQWLATSSTSSKDQQRHRNVWEVQALARQLLCAVMYLHDRGIIHKDIKPGNLLIHGDGRLLLADFDLSKDTTMQGGGKHLLNWGAGCVAVANATTTRSCLVGTPGYVAAEVQRGESATSASDMYSVGVVLFHMHFPDHPMLPVAGAIQIPEEADLDLKDLLMALLDDQPSRRPTASNALLHPYFRQTYVDRLVTGGELMEQNKKLEAVRALLYKSNVEQDQDDPLKVELDRSKEEGAQNVVKVLLDQYVGEMIASDPLALARPLKVTFTGECGVDQGGLLTEAYTLLFDAIVHEENGLFETATNGKDLALPSSSHSSALMYSLYLPKAGQEVVHDAIKMTRLKAFGILMAKCFYDGRRIGGHFAPSLFKYICGVDVNLQDLRQFDPQAGTSLRWILSSAGVKEVGLEFEVAMTTETAAAAATEAVEGGRSQQQQKKPTKTRPVTDQNKNEFARRKIQSTLIDCRRKQLEAIHVGFWWAIDGLFQNGAAFLKLLSHADWRVLLCGQENVNAAQILAVMRFKDFSKRNLQHGVPVWIKETVQGFSQDDLRRFLMFVTGSPSLPIAAVGNVEIVVRGLTRSNALPVAHTCFNEVDVPCYSDAGTFNDKLKMAMYESASFDKV